MTLEPEVRRWPFLATIGLVFLVAIAQVMGQEGPANDLAIVAYLILLGGTIGLVVSHVRGAREDEATENVARRDQQPRANWRESLREFLHRGRTRGPRR